MPDGEKMITTPVRTQNRVDFDVVKPPIHLYFEIQLIIETQSRALYLMQPSSMLPFCVIRGRVVDLDGDFLPEESI